MVNRKETLILFYISIVLVTSCQKGMNVKDILSQESNSFKTVNSPIHKEIATTFDKLLLSENLEQDQINDTTFFYTKEIKGSLVKNKVRQINIKNKEYNINDLNDITIISKVSGNSFKGGVKEGKYNGDLVVEDSESYKIINFDNGDTTKLMEMYRKGQQLKKVVQFENNIREGAYKEYYPNKTKKTEANYVSGQLHNQMKTWFESNKISSLLNFNNGSFHEEQKLFYDQTSTLKLSLKYKNGKKEGVAVGWFDNAKLKYKVTFENDVLNKNAVVYNKTGLLKMKGSYIKGDRNGKFTVWSDNGSAIYIANYKLGERVEILKGKIEDEVNLLKIEDDLYQLEDELRSVFN